MKGLKRRKMRTFCAQVAGRRLEAQVPQEVLIPFRKSEETLIVHRYLLDGAHMVILSPLRKRIHAKRIEKLTDYTELLKRE